MDKPEPRALLKPPRVYDALRTAIECELSRLEALEAEWPHNSPLGNICTLPHPTHSEKTCHKCALHERIVALARIVGGDK